MFSMLTPVTKCLLVANVAIYLGDILFFGKQLREHGSFSVQRAVFEGHVWEFITFQFLHGHFFHLFANSMGLFFFGPWMERWWGSRKFLAFYLLAGAGGAAFYTLLALLGVVGSGELVGASAGIYGILAGIALIAPNLRVALLFPPIELSMRQMAIALLAIAAVSITFELFGSSGIFGFFGNAGGEAGHLGGAIVGFLLVKFPQLLSWADRRDPDVENGRPRAFPRNSEPKLRPKSRVDLHQNSEIDLILDKISRDGFQSLTDEEREKLQRAANSNPSDR